jgi:hypothetical protein
MDTNYLRKINYKIFILVIGYLIPIVIWSMVIWKFLYGTYFTSIFSLPGLVSLVPIFIIFYNIYILYSTKTGLNFLVNACFDRNISEKQDEQGIIATGNISCANQMNLYIATHNHALTKYYYYISYLLFLMLLIIQYAKHDTQKTVKIMCLCWIISIIGMMTSVFFGGQNLLSIPFVYTGTSILNINLAALCICLLYFGSDIFQTVI